MITRIITWRDKLLILFLFPPTWIGTNSTDFKGLVTVMEESVWRGAHRAAATFWCQLALLNTRNLLLPVSGFLELARVLWAQQQSRVYLHHAQAFKEILNKIHARLFSCLFRIALWKSTSFILFSLRVLKALIFRVEFNISLPILLPSCQIQFQITGTTCLSWSKWYRLVFSSFLGNMSRTNPFCV